MQHSSEQKNREEEYARANQEYLERRRHELSAKPEMGEKDKGRRPGSKFCCVAVLALIIAAMALIAYFVINIKDIVVGDYFFKKEQIQKLLPQGQKEAEKGIQQGAELIGQTKETIEQAQEKYQETKETIEKVQSGYEKAKETYKKAEDVYEKIKPAVDAVK